MKLFACLSCHTPLAFREAILCPACASALKPAPPLCRDCGSPACEVLGRCQSPWSRLNQAEIPIRSWTAIHLLIEPGYTVLRAWKKRGSPLFDREALRWDAEARGRFLESEGCRKAQAIVPVPQRWLRSWRLGRSPADVITRWLARETGLPIARILRPPPRTSARQAQRGVQGRLENPLHFEVETSRLLLKRLHHVILADDFMTSGRTLRAAATALGKAGIRDVEVFCLGVRPRFTRESGKAS
jgi:predicted amidophosphoribosyltransferase